MEANQYLEQIAQRLSGYFDIESIFNYHGVTYDLYAKSFIRNEKYIASKKLSIYAFENNEHCFIKSVEYVRENHIYEMIEGLKKATEELVIPHAEHMSTVITGVLVTEQPVVETLKKEVERFKFSRSFAFGFKGWVYIRLILVDLTKEEVITNKRGREVKKFYAPNQNTKR